MTDLPSKFDIKFYEDINKPRLTIQLRMIPELVRTYNEPNSTSTTMQVTNLRTLCEMMNNVTSRKTMFREVCTLLHRVLTAPGHHYLYG